MRVPSHSAPVVLASLILLTGVALGAQEPCDPAQPSPPAASLSAPCIPAYTAEERLQNYVSRTLGPGAFVNSAVVAGIAQARNHPSAWEQGMEGYGRRYGSSFGKRAISNTIQLAAEAMLGEDSRYFPSGRESVWRRIQSAVLNSLKVRTRHGHRVPPVGRLAGAFGGGLLSRTWQPEGHDSFGDGVQSGGITFGLHVANNVFREFWPDLRKRLRF